MARPNGSSSGTADTRFHGNRATAGDPAPETDEISGTRADYAPTGADPKPTTGGTLKRTVKEFSEDNLTDWAAALTYYGVLALFPALIALLSIIGLLTDPKTLTDALTAVVPASAADTLNPVIEQLAGNTAPVGFGLVLGLAGAVWSASGYVGAFTRAANVVYETPEGRKVWKLKPLQLLVTLVGILFAAVIVSMLVLSGPVVDAVAQAIGLGDTGLTVWNVVKWPIVLVVLALMIAVLYYSTPNVRLRGFKWVSPGAGVAIVVAIVASAAFAFYVANFGSYNKTYGALAGVVVFLVWFWLINVALLFGIELDAEIERTRELKEGVPEGGEGDPARRPRRAQGPADDVTDEPRIVTSDFYDLEALLDDDDRTLLHRVRAFMDEQVEPVINEWWTRGKFPMDLIPGLAELGIAGTQYAGYGCPGRSPLTDGMIAMELSRGDPSISTFMGVHGGLAMGTIYLCGSEEQKERWLPPMARMELIGAFGLTEPDARLRHRPRRHDHGPPRRRRLGARRPEEVDRQRELRRPHDHLGQGRRYRAGARLRRREGHAGIHHGRHRGQDRPPGGAERADHPGRRPGAGGEPAAGGAQLPRDGERAAHDPGGRRVVGGRAAPAAPTSTRCGTP